MKPRANVNSQSSRQVLIQDLENELSQLQNEWAAVTEYCAELQQKQTDLAQEFGSVDLEERLLTKKLHELLGSSEEGNDDGDTQQQQEENDKKNKKKEFPRILSAEQKENVRQIFFRSESEEERKVQESDEGDENEGEEQQKKNLRQNDDEEFVFSDDQPSFFSDPSLITASSAERMNVSQMLLKLLEQFSESQQVSNVLQKQKEILSAKLQQCAAVSVALDAMMLYRQPIASS